MGSTTREDGKAEKSASTPARDDATDWQQPQRLFLSLENCTALVERREQAYALLLHPASQHQLRLVLNQVLHRWARHADLRADVAQEATLRLVGDLLRPTLFYENRGPEQFAGWLWCRWFAACRTAWRHCQPLWLRRIAHAPSDELAQVPARDSRQSSAQLLVQRVTDRADGVLRETLTDWLDGISLRESATRWGVSKSVVARRRKQLATLFNAARREDGQRVARVPADPVRERPLPQPS